ncbi:MAG: exodeoxyribonuclease V subunit gamma [Leucothrix sp.]
MFVLHTSNRAENLIEHLIKILETSQQDVFSKEVFLIQSQGMERWLSQQLAEKKGLWANFEYLFPARFFNDMSQKLGLKLEQDAFSRENLLWHFEALLRDIADPALHPLANYLVGETQARKRYQLAQQLAYLFDQYMFMRPDWLAAWQRNETINTAQNNEVIQRNQQWQSVLWRQLLGSLGPEPAAHRGECWLAAIEHLNASRLGDFAGLLPERISVIGINTLTPLYLGYLQALSKHIQVHFYLLNPCQEFWAESNKTIKAQLNQQVVQSLSVNAIDEEPINATLGLLGQQGRDFQALLLDQYDNEVEISSFDAIETDGELSLLAQLQNDILLNRAGDPHYQIADTDHSISIHACHTRLREIEVLKDQLIARFDADDALDLRDVVVMAPDIQIYLPYINAVFDDMPYAVADRSLRQTNGLLDILLRFFELSQSRFIWHEVLAVFEEPVVRERFGLCEADLSMVRHWVEDTRIRWGESAEHRITLGMDGFTENSWQSGLERLLMGYAVPTDDQFSDGILPYTDIEGSQAQILGSFYAFYRLLKRARKQLTHARSLVQWLKVLHDYSAQLLSDNNDLRLQWDGLRELFDGLAETAAMHQQKLSLEVLLEHLKSLADEQKTATGFMRGQLTFCSMLPMRAIPFSTIALLGMNEGEFPNVDGGAAFDLMDQDFRRGDRSRRADERYQFLETILSSRKQLLMSYVGQSIKNNDEIPPSVVVSELLDALNQYYHIPQSRVLTKHPLQAFSPRYFLPDSDLFSYSHNAAEVATALQQTRSHSDDFWWQGDLLAADVPEAAMQVDLDDLFRFFHNPQRYFVEKHLQLRTKNDTDLLNETEVFELNHLERYWIDQEWIERQLYSKSTDEKIDYLQRLRAEGRWPPGPMGDQLFRDMEQELDRFVSNVRGLAMGAKLENPAIDYVLDGGVFQYQLQGKLRHAYQNGHLFYRYAKCKPSDQLAAWLNHLIALNDPLVSPSPVNTYLMHKDSAWQFEPVAESTNYLSAMLDIYRQAQKTLSSLVTPAAFAWAESEAKTNNRSKKTPLQVALEAFETGLEYDSDWQLLYRTGSAETLFGDEGFSSSISLIIEPLVKCQRAVSV